MSIGNSFILSTRGPVNSHPPTVTIFLPLSSLVQIGDGVQVGVGFQGLLDQPEVGVGWTVQAGSSP